MTAERSRSSPVLGGGGWGGWGTWQGRRPQRRRGAVAGRFGRQSPGHELVEKDAERPDVGRRGHRLAAALFRRGALRRHRRELERTRRLGGVVARREELGDAKVEQVHPAVGAHQHIRRLEIAMDDEIGVRELHRPAKLDEELRPAARRGRGLGAKLGDRPAVDIAQRQIGPPVVGRAGVEERHDRRVLETGEEIALEPEAGDEIGRGDPRPQKLDRHLLGEGAVGALGEIDLAHAPAGEKTHDLPRSQAGARDDGG